MSNLSSPARQMMDEVALVYGFAITDGVASPNHNGAAVADDVDYVWCHVNLASESGLHWVKSHANLAAQLVSAFCDRNEENGIYSFGTGILLVVEDRLKSFGDDPLELGPLHVWVEPKRIITARWHPLAAPDRLRFRLQVGASPQSSVGLAIELLVEIVNDLENIGRKTISTIDALEDRVLDNESTGIAAEIGAARRQVIRLRRQVLPLRQIIARAAADLPHWASAEESSRIDTLLSRIERAGSEIVEAQEQARILQDESSARAAERTNNSMYVLTLFTVIILPLNLITGFFGMNVQGLPGVGVDGGFEAVFWGMIATFVLTVAYFKYKKWF